MRGWHAPCVLATLPVCVWHALAQVSYNARKGFFLTLPPPSAARGEGQDGGARGVRRRRRDGGEGGARGAAGEGGPALPRELLVLERRGKGAKDRKNERPTPVGRGAR